MSNELAVMDSGLLMLSNTLENSQLSGMLARWKSEFDSFKSDIERDLKILHAIRNGYDTIPEILSVTGFSRGVCDRRIRVLIRKKKIKRTKCKCPHNSGKGFLYRLSVLNES